MTSRPPPFSTPNHSKKVRQKLAASLRGKDTGTLAAAEGDLAERGTGEATAPPAAASAAAAATGAGGDVVTIGALLSAAAAVLESPGQQLGQFDPAARAAVEHQGKEEQLEDLDKPLVLTGAIDMLGTALVVLPAKDAAGARHCVG